MRNLFGVTLNPSASELLSSVEAHYGCPLFERERSDWPTYAYGRAYVENNGTPVIEVNAATGRTEVTVIHELFHLYLQAVGFPILQLQGHDGFARKLVRPIWDSILHSIIFPKMREQGIDADVQLRSDCEDALASRDILQGFNRHQKTAWYFTVLLETEDLALTNRIRQWFEQHDPEAYERGQRMVAQVPRGNAITPKEAIDTLLSCMNILFATNTIFQLVDVRQDKIGMHTRHVAIIVVSAF